jgi:hypothetical protein
MSSKRSGIAAASINNDIYVFGGEERSKTSNNNEEYDVIIIEGQLNLQCQHTDCKTAWLSNYYLSLFVCRLYRYNLCFFISLFTRRLFYNNLSESN